MVGDKILNKMCVYSDKITSFLTFSGILNKKTSVLTHLVNSYSYLTVVINMYRQKDLLL